jgi:hypothetical protein
VRDDTVSPVRGGGARKTRVGFGLGRLGQLLDRGRDLFRPCQLLVSLGSGTCTKTVRFDTRRYWAATRRKVSRGQFL